MPLSEIQVPYTGPYSIEGNGKHKGNTPLALKRAMARLNFLPWEPDVWDNVFNAKLEGALDKWDAGKDGYAEGRWQKIRDAKTSSGAYALDSTAQKLIRDEFQAEQPRVPNLGPVFNGGKSVLMHDCTHATGGIPLFPAFDDAFKEGTGIIAPENMEVYKASSSRPGDACYCQGASSIRYWIGHLRSAPAVGRKLQKGDLIGRVCENKIGGGPHVHVGVNVENLWGVNKQLDHHTNYTHGAGLIGEQLREFNLGL